MSGKINQGSGTMGALINDKSMYQHVNKAASELQENMDALKHNFLLNGFFQKRGYDNSADLTKHQIAHLLRSLRTNVSNLTARRSSINRIPRSSGEARAMVVRDYLVKILSSTTNA
jgi:hypothetical protein